MTALYISRRLVTSSFSRAFSTAIVDRDSAMSALLKSPRRFAPLKGNSDKDTGGVPKLKGVVFDVDGTLCLPQPEMFIEMRSALGIPPGTDILEHVSSLPVSEQESAMRKVHAAENSAMFTQVPQPGLVSLMEYLESRTIPKGICTRNVDAPVNHLLGKFLAGQSFSPIVTRDFKPPKPDPAGILHIAKTWGLEDAGGLIMVGDSIDDMTAGYRAGAATVLLVNDINAHLARHEHTDLCISRLDELIDILEKGFVGQIGRAEEDADTRGRAERVLREGRGEEAGAG